MDKLVCGRCRARSPATIAQLHRFAATLHIDLRGAAERSRREAIVERIGIIHGLAIDGDDQVRQLEAGPGRRAGLATTLATSAPDGKLQTRASRRSPASPPASRAPSQGRLTALPPLLAEATTTRTMFEGIAKPMPCEPPEREKIAVLTPTSFPAMSTSAPPELPGLIGGIGLDKELIVRNAHLRTRQRRDDAMRHGLSNTEGIADREHDIAHQQFIRVRKIQRREFFLERPSGAGLPDRYGCLSVRSRLRIRACPTVTL